MNDTTSLADPIATLFPGDQLAFIIIGSFAVTFFVLVYAVIRSNRAHKVQKAILEMQDDIRAIRILEERRTARETGGVRPSTDTKDL